MLTLTTTLPERLADTLSRAFTQAGIKHTGKYTWISIRKHRDAEVTFRCKLRFRAEDRPKVDALLATQFVSYSSEISPG